MVRQMWHSQMGPDADFTRIVQSKCAHAVPATQEFRVSQPSQICAGPRLSKDTR